MPFSPVLIWYIIRFSCEILMFLFDGEIQSFGNISSQLGNDSTPQTRKILFEVSSRGENIETHLSFRWI